MPKVSIIIPVYNEERLLPESLPPIFGLDLDKEIIAVNDGSSDNSLGILEEMSRTYDFKIISLSDNSGKGAAILAGLQEAAGEYFIIFDADSEYDPGDIGRLLQEAEKYDDGEYAFYGSRFLGKNKVSFHFLVNRFLTSMTNMLFGSKLTDMETCLKLIPLSSISEMTLLVKRFEIEPVITAQLLKRGYAIKEIPVSYTRRSYEEGKKIKARDGLIAISSLLKERFVRD